MRIESRSVAVVHRRRAHQLGVVAFAIVCAVFVATPFVRPAYMLFGLAAPILSLLAILRARRGAGVRGSIELTDDGVRVGDTRTIARDEIDGAVVRDGKRCDLEIGLRNGDVLSVALEHASHGHAFVRKLSQRRLSIRAEQPHFGWAPLATSSGLILWLLVLVENLAARSLMPNPLVRVLLFAAAILATWVIVHLRASAGLVIARDGITVARAFSARFYPWTAIARTQRLNGKLHLVLHDGRDVVLTRSTHTPLQSRVLIDRALAQSHTREEDAATAALEREGRPIDAWRTALVALTGDDAAYRGVHLPRTTLEDVLDDPAAPAERRIGAALALSALDPEYATRVRLAAESCANEHLRIALEGVVDGALEVGSVDDAVSAEQA